MLRLNTKGTARCWSWVAITYSTTISSAKPAASSRRRRMTASSTSRHAPGVDDVAGQDELQPEVAERGQDDDQGEGDAELAELVERETARDQDHPRRGQQRGDAPAERESDRAADQEAPRKQPGPCRGQKINQTP